MDLWIRSQQKNILQKVSKLYVTTYAEENGYGVYDIQEVDDCDIPLGFYETRERALEVLDEIQRLISLDLLNENISYQEADIYLKTAMLDRMARIYEMPKE